MLQLDGLSRTFDRIVALDGVSFEVPRGRLTGFLGPNGAGKTTAMRIVMGISVPSRGSVSWDGAPIGLAQRKRFGYMPEERGLYPKMKIADQVAYLGRLHGMSRSDARARAVQWLTRVGLEERLDRPLQELSQGNQQRVQLAAALVHDPEVLILDEPFSGLDPIAVEVMADVLRDRAREGAAVLFSSHQLDLVEDLCEDVVIIHEGKVRLQGVLRELRGRGRQRLLVAVDNAPPGWADRIAGTELLSSDEDGRVLLVLDEGTRPRDVLAAASALGELTHFAAAPPALSELFLDAVGFSPEPGVVAPKAVA